MKVGEARSGGSAGTVALEQLSRLCLSGERSGRNKSVGPAKAEDHRADKFPNVMHPTRPGLEPRETRGTRHSRFPADCGPGYQPATTGVERHRSHQEPGQERQHQDRGHWRFKERTAADTGAVRGSRFPIGYGPLPLICHPDRGLQPERRDLRLILYYPPRLPRLASTTRTRTWGTRPLSCEPWLA